MLYICATPIGNMDDITLRVKQVLSEVDLILAEDTRHTGLLMKHHNIKGKLSSYREQNREKTGTMAIELLKLGKNVALVSDAGLPTISDPGGDLVRKCVEENIAFTVLPGACAYVTALAASGFDTKSIFLGFLSLKPGKRKKSLEKIKDLKFTIILYESPHRLVKTLNDALEVLGDRNIVIARELTKKFEEIKRGKTSELAKYFTKIPPKGEIVILVEGE